MLGHENMAEFCRTSAVEYLSCANTMLNHETVLIDHAQHYQNSCAASGMELILKLHSLVNATFRDFQDKYGDTNIGFEKLADMASYGVHAQDHEKPIDEGCKSIKLEVRRGHFPILSVYSKPLGWHIWVAVPDGASFRLVSRAYRNDKPLKINDLDVVRQNLNKFSGGRVHFVTYMLAKPNGT